MEFILKTTLWSLCGKDNKWPWLRRSCYRWLWSLAGLAVETQYTSCNLWKGLGVAKKQPKPNRKRKARANTSSFFRKCGAEIKTIKLGSWLKHLWEPQPCHKITQAFKSDPKAPAPNTTSVCCTLFDTGEVMVKPWNLTATPLLWAEEDTLPSWTNSI